MFLTSGLDTERPRIVWNIRNMTETRQTDDGLGLTEAEIAVGSQNSLKSGINSGLNFGSDAGADMEMERNYAMSERSAARRLMPVIQEDREPMETHRGRP